MIVNKIYRLWVLSGLILGLTACTSISTNEAAKIYQEQGSIALYRYQASQLLGVNEQEIEIQEPFQSTLNRRNYLAITKGKSYHCSLGIFTSVVSTSIVNAQCNPINQ
ncbi:hypothetical protein [Stenoxybacter acetivorans]|uniref:hypothetical protein n=1 Tax=Stenoxybacter acetivorans TaxID=422441 RepID=UPI00056D6F80|nr:hypothetical protein [Stenoxybacter acetivorans]